MARDDVRQVRVLIVTMIALVVGACERPAERAPEGLELGAARPDLISGSYRAGGTTLQFTASESEGHLGLLLRSGGGQPLLEVRDDPQTGIRTSSYLGGRLQVLVALRSANPAAGAQDPALPWSYQFTGDKRALGDFSALPEVALLIDASKALAAMGYDRQHYPAARRLEIMAMSIAQTRGADTASDLAVAMSALCNTRGTGDCGPPPFTPPPITGPPPACPEFGHYSLLSDPCHNQCYGMCGPGCDPWEWVCNDTSYHPGCAIHDDWCRACDNGDDSYCLLCYDPAALIAIVDC